MSFGGRDPDGVRLAVWGVTRYGKSYWIRENVVGRFRRVAVVDPEEEYGDLTEATVYSPAAAKRWLLDRGAGDVRATYRLAMVPRTARDGLAYCRLLFTLRDSWAVLEELSWWIRQVHPPPPELTALISRGGKRGANVVTVSQRPQDTPPAIRSQADARIVFRVDSGREMEYVAHYLDDAELARVARLGRGDFLWHGRPEKIENSPLDLPLDRRAGTS